MLLPSKAAAGWVEGLKAGRLIVRLDNGTVRRARAPRRRRERRRESRHGFGWRSHGGVAPPGNLRGARPTIDAHDLCFNHGVNWSKAASRFSSPPRPLRVSFTRPSAGGAVGRRPAQHRRPAARLAAHRRRARRLGHGKFRRRRRRRRPCCFHLIRTGHSQTAIPHPASRTRMTRMTRMTLWTRISDSPP